MRRIGRSSPSGRSGPHDHGELRPIGGSIAVLIPRGSITYRYDDVTNRYVRYINSAKKPQVDIGDGKVVAPTNVVILRMKFGALIDGHPDKNRLEAQNVGKGVAWIATNGRTIKGTWSKASPRAPTLLFGPRGTPITLTAGQTFVQVIKPYYDLVIKDGRPPAWIPPPHRDDL